MTSLALAAVALLSRPAAAQELLLVADKTIAIQIKAEGVVEAQDAFLLRSAGEGRVETVDVSSGQWALKRAALATMADADMTALMDSPTSTPKDILKSRWKPVYQAVPIECRKDCFILKVFVAPKNQVKAHAALFEAARALVMTGKILGDASRFARDGQVLRYWPKEHPDPRRSIELSGYKPPPDDETSSAALEGIFSREMPENNWLAPGTAWEGLIVAATFQDPLAAPGGSLVCVGEDAFFAVRFPTGTMSVADVEGLKMRVEGGRLLFTHDKSPLGPGFCRLLSRSAGAENALREFPIIDARRPPEPPREPDFSGDPYGSATP